MTSHLTDYVFLYYHFVVLRTSFNQVFHPNTLVIEMMKGGGWSGGWVGLCQHFVPGA